MPKHPLCLHHELALLVLDDSKGTFEGTMYQYGLAGAVLSELLLQGYIGVTDDKKSKVSIQVDQPSGDSLLDETLAKISASSKPRNLQYWVSKVASSKNLKERIAEQLCELGILRQEEGKILWIFTRKIWPELDGSYEDEIRKRMAEVMFRDTQELDERTVVLVALANGCGVLKANFAPVELRQHKARIKEISEGKLLAAGATKDAIVAAQAAIIAAMIATSAAVSAASASS